jgi:hypothetical protein
LVQAAAFSTVSSRAILCALVILSSSVAARAQDIRLYSEFERFDPFGEPVDADRDLNPREILSPAMARNGHLSLHVVITAPAGTNYLLYTGSNPPGILQVRLYREHFSRCGAAGYCPDWLTPQNTPAFGAIPEYDADLTPAARARQTARCYLLDIWAPPDTPPRRVRVEALLKVGTWYVAPLEVRVVEPTVPDNVPSNSAPNVDADPASAENIASIDAPSSATAQLQLLRYLAGLPPQIPTELLRIRDFIQRNAAEDMLVARSLELRKDVPGPRFAELNLLSWSRLAHPGLGAEWYLKVRDFLYRSGI